MRLAESSRYLDEALEICNEIEARSGKGPTLGVVEEFRQKVARLRQTYEKESERKREVGGDNEGEEGQMDVDDSVVYHDAPEIMQETSGAEEATSEEAKREEAKRIYLSGGLGMAFHMLFRMFSILTSM